MGFFDTLKDKLKASSSDQYFDDGYDDYYDDDVSAVSDPEPAAPAYGAAAPAPAYGSSQRYGAAGQGTAGSYNQGGFGATGAQGGRGFAGIAPMTAVQSQLPPYVIHPVSYDDVQTVIRRVRTNQPVVMDLHGCQLDTAKRILDFSYGFACGVEGCVQELGGSVFVVLPKGKRLSEADYKNLQLQGIQLG